MIWYLYKNESCFTLHFRKWDDTNLTELLILKFYNVLGQITIVNDLVSENIFA